MSEKEKIQVSRIIQYIYSYRCKEHETDREHWYTEMDFLVHLADSHKMSLAQAIQHTSRMKLKLQESEQH